MLYTHFNFLFNCLFSLICANFSLISLAFCCSRRLTAGLCTSPSSSLVPPWVSSPLNSRVVSAKEGALSFFLAGDLLSSSGGKPSLARILLKYHKNIYHYIVNCLINLYWSSNIITQVHKQWKRVGWDCPWRLTYTWQINDYEVMLWPRKNAGLHNNKPLWRIGWRFSLLLPKADSKIVQLDLLWVTVVLLLYSFTFYFNQFLSVIFKDHMVSILIGFQSLTWAFSSSLVPSWPKCVSAWSKHLNKQTNAEFSLQYYGTYKIYLDCLNFAFI